jgi:hypothetical protein
VVINELVADPADEEVEWIELYNKTNLTIDLTDWTIEDNTEKPVDLEELIIEPLSSLVLNKDEHFSFALNNGGDVVRLKFQNSLIDQIVYGSYNDGDLSDNAPQAVDPNSIARIRDGCDTNNDLNDFNITTTPTPGKTNLISQNESLVVVDYPRGIIINEILPNPEGSDNLLEFIELKNISANTINLENWQLTDQSSRVYTFKKDDFENLDLSANGFFTVYREVSKIALNNSGSDGVYLRQPDGTVIDQVGYEGKIVEGQSYSLENNKWWWTLKSTPNAENIIQQPNQSPKAVINMPNQAEINQEVVLDASDSYDPDGEKLKYLWTLESGLTDDRMVIKHIFNQAGEFKIKLQVTDERDDIDEVEFLIQIGDGTLETPMESLSAELALITDLPMANFSQEIIITEFIPNPEGSDENEWIEIYNTSLVEVNLNGWSLDDQADGGSRPYQIKEDKIILPGEYLVIQRSESKLALNNDVDSVRLLDKDNQVVGWVDYVDSKEGLSYNLFDDGQWYWSGVMTPGAANVVDILNQESIVKTSQSTINKNQILTLPLSEVKVQEIGDQIKTQGTVAVEPGLLGSQIFYLAGSGIQVYCYKKDFPDLKLGDYIEVVGTLSESGGEKRLKINSQEDIVILDHSEAPLGHEIEIGQIGDGFEGNLVTVTGEIIEVRGNTFYLDDGGDEIKVYIKSTANISKIKLSEGMMVKVTGIVSQTSSGYRLLPRYDSDFEFNQDLLAGDAAKMIEVGDSSQQKDILQYLVATIVILIGALIVLGVRHRQIIKK